MTELDELKIAIPLLVRGRLSDREREVLMRSMLNDRPRLDRLIEQESQLAGMLHSYFTWQLQHGLSNEGEAVRALHKKLSDIVAKESTDERQIVTKPRQWQ